MATNNDRFQFQLLPRDILQTDMPKETVDLLGKWGMADHMKFKSFSYNKHFQLYQKQTFVEFWTKTQMLSQEDFFTSEAVNSIIEVRTKMDSWRPLNMSQSISSVSVHEVPATILSLNFFDRLTLSGSVARDSGHIVKCFDEMADGFLVSDELQKMFLVEESDNYTIYNDDEKKEFLYKILQHLVLGGPVNQYEDILEPYLSTAKLLYKALLLVVKDMNTKQLSIASHVLDVKAKVGDSCVFPSTKDHAQSFCYLIIDNVKRHFYHFIITNGNILLGSNGKDGDHH